MGAGKIFNLHETDETRRSGAREAFEKILERVETSGGEITKDETVPLYTDIGAKEAEVGTERVIEFSLGKNDFQIIRKSETQRVTGAGHQKSLEPMNPPRIKTVLKKKDSISNDWQIIDLENLL